MATHAAKTITPNGLREAIASHIDGQIAAHERQYATRPEVHKTIKSIVTHRELTRIAVENHIPIERLQRYMDGVSHAITLDELRKLLDSVAEVGGPSVHIDPDRDTFVATPTARKIFGVLDLAGETPHMALVYGGAGVGKSMALRAYVARHDHAVLVAATAAHKTTNQILARLAAQLGPPGDAKQSDALFDSVLTRCRRDGKSLIIIDEAQHLKLDTFDVFRDFFDSAGFGIVYVGNEQTYGRIGGHSKIHLPQIYSRLAQRLHIPRPTPQDVDFLLDAHRLGGKELRTYAIAVANSAYGLRGLMQIITRAKRDAEANETPVTDGHLRMAATFHGLELTA